MRLLCLALSLGLAVLISSAASASELDDHAFAKAVEGTYILFEKDGFQRVLSLSRGGNVSQVSDQEKSYGYTTGLGAWTRTGAHQIRARVIDFEFDLDKGTPTGVARIDFVITLSKIVSTHYQAVSGTFVVQSYATGQNPLSPSEAPMRAYDDAFTGSRVAFAEKP